MSTLSKTSVEIPKTVKAHPCICATEIGEHMGERPRLQYISALLKMGLLQIGGVEDRPSSSGAPRKMNLYSITHAGAGVLQRTLEQAAIRKPVKPKVYAQLATVRTPFTRPETKMYDNGCSVATGREAKATYEPYTPPKPTGRGYAQTDPQRRKYVKPKENQIEKSS